VFKEGTTKKVLRIVLPFITFGLIIYFILELINIIVLIAISILLAFILKPLVGYLEFMKIPRVYASLISVISAVGFIGFLVYYFIPIIANQFDNLLILFRDLRIQDLITQLEKKISSTFPFIRRGEIIKHITRIFQTGVENLVTDISNFIPKVFTIAAFILIVPFITFFILKDSRNLKIGIINLLPNRYFEMAYEIFQKVTDELGKFVRGWIFDAMFVGFCVMVGLYIIGINNFVMLGLLAGVGHLIPYLGPLIGILPAILVSYYQMGNFSLAMPILILFAIIYTIDNGFVQPIIYSKSLRIHPVVIILLILIGSELFGILGLLLAVPVANILRVLATEIYRGYKSYQIARF
jgi:predicted PurR-regulated permease PerM